MLKRDDVLRMAEEVGIVFREFRAGDNKTILSDGSKTLEVFEAFAAAAYAAGKAAEREARIEAQRTLQQVQEQMQRAGVVATKEAYRRGVEDEREACARMCDDMEKAANEPKWAIWTAEGEVSAAIRARK